jgi:preprotein translocase subunit YajC
MKTTSQRVAWFVLLVMILAVFTPLVSRSQTSTAQKAQAMKWKFGGNDAGTSSYVTHADGTFESSD